MFDAWQPIEELASAVRTKKTTAVQLVTEAIRRADASSDYNALLYIARDRALQRAHEIDKLITAGKTVGALAGVPFIAKDNFLTVATPTTAASHILEPFAAPYQATAIYKLEAAGAIMIAKANLDAFAHGSSTENSAFGPTKNPVDKTRVSGGSSGGSGAAVALNIAPFALGTDTGGSIRLPASFCGIVGLKPTYGLVSRFGVVAMASSTDVIGPLTKTVDDAAIVLDVMSGRDNLDGTTIERDKTAYTKLATNLTGIKVGVIKEFFSDGLDKGVETSVLKTVKNMTEAGAEVIDVSLPSIDLALACYYIIVPAEISSNLSRYDGQRYGLSAPNAKDLTESYEIARENGFEAENKRRIMIGTYVLSSGYYDAYYKRAQTVRTKLIQEFTEVFSKVDVIVGPTAPLTAFKLGENVDDPLQMYLADIMTVAANLVGIPAISIPAAPANGLPVGIQFMAPQHRDRELLGVAKAVEQLV